MDAKGQVLLINPWIYDFAAYNSWIEPLGLLAIAAVLCDNGYAVTVIDCLAPHPGSPSPRPDGSGKFLKTAVTKPGVVASVPRHYGRYGLPLEQFDAALIAAPRPDLVLVASGMTYWYPGVQEAIKRVRCCLGKVPVALGGIYATLCPDHARQVSGADRVIEGPGIVAALQMADEVTDHDSVAGRYANPGAWPPPAHDVVTRPYAGLITSWGCPFRCTYCASHRLQPVYVQRQPDGVVEEIAECVARGVCDFVFYDDALLVNSRRGIIPILQKVISLGWPVRFHTPNGLHAREITPDLAYLMRRAGLATVRLSLETTDATRQRVTGGKVSTAAFERAVGYLNAVGYGRGELAAYILAGLPEQPLSEVEATIRFVQDLGVQAKLALFSPIPGTPDGDRALPEDADPLLHNNTVYPYHQGAEYGSSLQHLKLIAKEGNATLLS